MNNNIICVVHVCKEAVQYTSKACLQVLLAQSSFPTPSLNPPSLPPSPSLPPLPFLPPSISPSFCPSLHFCPSFPQSLRPSLPPSFPPSIFPSLLPSFHLSLPPSLPPSSLEQLSLKCCQLDDSFCDTLSSSLSSSSSSSSLSPIHCLYALDLSCNKIGDDGLRHLARALRVNQTLIFLGLSGNQIGDNGVKDFCKVREREGEG